jgi:hypothetical protein
VNFGLESDVGPNLFRRPQKSRAHIMSCLAATGGCPLVVQLRFDPEEDLVNEKGLVYETSS